MPVKSVRVACLVKKWTLEAVYGAAYVLTDRAYASISGNPKTTLHVSLRPKSAAGAAADLKKIFLEELNSQKIRWEIARNNQSIREYIVEMAVRGAQNPQPPAPSAVPELSAEERQEIERLIAEVESEIKERKKTGSDPLNIAATWEQRHALETKN